MFLELNESNRNKSKILFEKNKEIQNPILENSDLKLMNEKNKNTNNYKSAFNDFNLKEPEIQLPPSTLTKNFELNTINYDEFSIEKNNQYNDLKNETNIKLNNNACDTDEINNILNLNKKAEDLEQINYNFNYNNCINNKIINSKQITNFSSNNEKAKETCDFNDVVKILAKDINKDYCMALGNKNDKINNNGNNPNYYNSDKEKNDFAKLIEENNSLKNKLNAALMQINEYKLKETEFESTDKEIENKLQSLQNKLDIYDTSLENTKKQYEEQIINYQKEVKNLNIIIKIINNFFYNISNKYVKLNINYKYLDISILEHNLYSIEKYLNDLNQELNQNGKDCEEYNIQNEKDYLPNLMNINDLNYDNQNYEEIKNNYKYNSSNSDNKNSDSSDLYNNNNFIHEYNIIDGNNNFKFRMNNKLESNDDYRSLERRVFMLEKKLINQQNIYNNINDTNKDKNYYPCNTQENLNIFKNGILSEKVRPLSVKNSNNKRFKINAKIKKKKRKTKLKSNED